MSEILISIITPSYNQGEYIEETIMSVLNGGYENLEHIIIDGGSTDNTLDILRKYKHLNWISEPDNGQTEAINKGFKMAKGDIIGWLNSDDLYHINAIRVAVEAFDCDLNCEFIYPDICRINDKSDITEVINIKEFCLDDVVKTGNTIAQPGVFFRRSIFDKIGYLNESFHYAMDLEFWLRMAKNKINMKKINRTLAYFREHGESKTVSLANKFWEEEWPILRYYGSTSLPPVMIKKANEFFGINLIKKILFYLEQKRTEKRFIENFFGKSI